MASSLPLSCRCGAVRGSLNPASPSHGRRLVCMCDDCQTFAEWLGEPEKIFEDEAGGTEIYQTTPRRLEVTEGLEHIRCARLSPKGILRWYTDCCRTPVANMVVGTRLPFLGIAVAFVDVERHGRSLDDAIGPLRARINARFSRVQPPPKGAHLKAPFGLVLQIAAGFAMDALRGQHRPTPLRTADGEPIVTPTVLSRDERKACHARCGPPEIT